MANLHSFMFFTLSIRLWSHFNILISDVADESHSLHYLEAFERLEVIFVFTQNLPPPSEAAAAALNFHWDSAFFFFFLLKVNNPDPPGCSDRPLTHTQLMSLISLTHRFCKFLLWKLHSCLGPRLRWRRLCGRFKRNHRGFPFTFPRTAVINQQLMISMADMRGAAELFLLMTFSDSLAHVCVRVCVNEISPVPKRPCFYPPSLFSTLNNVSFFSLSYLNILVTVVVLSGVVILSIYFKYCEPVKQLFTLRHQSDGWRSRRVDLFYHQIYSAVWLDKMTLRRLRDHRINLITAGVRLWSGFSHHV